jgi:WD40 repeat protein
LLRRGLGVAGAFVLWTLTRDTAAAALSGDLMRRATSAAGLAGGARPPGPAAELAEGVMRAMTWNTIKTRLVFAALLLACVGVAVALTRGVLADKPPDSPPPAAAQDGHPLPGQFGPVAALAVSADGKLLAAGCADKSVRFWDLPARKELFAVKDLPDPVNSVGFSPDGKTLAAACGRRDSWAQPVGNGVVVLVDVAGRKVRDALHQTGEPRAVGFSPDGKTLAVGGTESVVRLYDTAGIEVYRVEGLFGYVGALAFSPDGSRLAAATNGAPAADGAPPPPDAVVWDVKTHKELLRRHDASTALAFTPDGKGLAGLGSASVLDVETGKVRTEVPAPGRPAGLAVSPDGKAVAAGSGHDVVRYDLTTGKSLPTLSGHTFLVRGLAFSPDGKTLASASEDWSVRLWDAETGKETATLTHGTRVYAVAVSPDGKRVVSAGHDAKVKVWDATSHEEVAVLAGHTGGILGVAWSPDGKWLASTSQDGTARLWDVAAGKEKHVLKLGSGGRSVAFFADGRLLATAGQDSLIRLWDVATGEERLRP